MITGKDILDFINSPDFLTENEIYDLLDKELEKDKNEIDTDFVDELIKAICEKENNDNKKIPSSEKMTYKHKNIKTKTIIAAAVVIIMLIVGTTVIATGIDLTTVFEYISHRIEHMIVGEKDSYNEIDFINTGEALTFESVDDFKKSYTETILVPQKFPENVSFSKIEVRGSLDKSENYTDKYVDYCFLTNSTSTNIKIHTNPDFKNTFLEVEDCVFEVINEYSCYIYQFEEFTQCSFVYNDYVYVICADSLENIHFIINNLLEM